MKLKTIGSIVLTLTLSACGTDVVEGPQGSQGEQGPQGEPGETVETLPEFIGEFYMPFSGFVITTVNHENEYSIDANFQFLNPDNSICNLDLDALLIDLHDGVILYSGVVAMTAGNCKSDANVALLTAALVTYPYEVALSFNDDGLLEARLLIFQLSSGVRTLVVSKTLTEE